MPVSRDAQGILWFMLAKHPSGDLGDFGGGVKKGESSLDAAKREIEEETNGLSEEMIPKNFDYGSAIGLIHKNLMAMVFIPVDAKWIDSAKPRFEEISQQRKNTEIVDIVWVDETAFEKMIGGEEVFHPPGRHSGTPIAARTSWRSSPSKTSVRGRNPPSESYLPREADLASRNCSRSRKEPEVELFLWRKVRMFLMQFSLPEIFGLFRFG